MKQKRPIDLAKEFRQRVLKSWQESSEPWPLEGLKQFPCERTVYVSLKTKETPALLFRAIFKHWKELFQSHGDAIACIGNMISLIVTPAGEAFCSFRIAQFPSLGQTESEMIPKVEKSVELLQAFANQTNRLTATIHDGSVLMFSDGRRFLLSECECCNRMNDEVGKYFKISTQQKSAL